MLYCVFDEYKEVRIYDIFSQRQDYLQLICGRSECSITLINGAVTKQLHKLKKLLVDFR